MSKLISEKKKKKIIIYLILWLLIAIVFVLPMAIAQKDAVDSGVTIGIDNFNTILMPYVLDFSSRIKAFESNYISTTKSVISTYSVIYIFVMIILFLKSKDEPDGEYHDIEHGSSDWCVGGEQYKVLSKDSGIVLAKKNYLPINKPGNVNVLVIGRIWIW